jgi:glycosyltransferase involved in cell wall biosynthesis
MLDCITPLILTYNESPNISRTLERLSWAKKVIIIDSYSTDNTLAIIKSYPQVEIFQRKFDSFAEQCNYGLEKITSEWILSLDADYILSDKLIEELHTLKPLPSVVCYSVRFKYCVFGKPLQGTLLPPRKVLYKREKAIYENDGHAHRVVIEGDCEMLSAYIHHDDRKPLSRWLLSQDRYMLIEAQKLLETPEVELSFGDRIRKQKFFAPFIIFFYCLIIKVGILDGKAGWYYAFQRMLAEILLALCIIEYEKLQKASIYEPQ